MSGKHLKEYQYYLDLYDRSTVDYSRNLEKLWDEKSEPVPEDKKISKKEAARVYAFAKKFSMRIHTGERYVNKEKIIQMWMDADRKRDEIYESAKAPENIRCLTCHNLLKPTFKELWYEGDKEDRVLFMYDCPNKCLPRRAFFSDGSEWRSKSDLCPYCTIALKHSEIDDGKKLVTTLTCQKCNYSKTDEYVWTHKSEPQFDKDFVRDRDRFCLTDAEGQNYRDEKWRMEQMKPFLEEWEQVKKAREEKLAENPKGFVLDGAGYTCYVCGDGTEEDGNWYDKYGIKCQICMGAVGRKEIPASLDSRRKTWYSKYDLESCFNIKGPTLRSWIKKGILKPKTVTINGSGIHVQIFLIKDNKDTLPPKKLVESHSVSEERDGTTWHRVEPWYKFVDPVKHLKEYKIMNYLKVTHGEENSTP